MTDAPWEVLRRAADLLEQLAGKATPGPWRRHDTWLDVGGHTATVLSGEESNSDLRAWLPSRSGDAWDTKRNVWNDAVWIAAMSPDVAEPLVAWLRFAAWCWETAGDLETAGIGQAGKLVSDGEKFALTFANKIIGESE